MNWFKRHTLVRSIGSLLSSCFSLSLASVDVIFWQVLAFLFCRIFSSCIFQFFCLVVIFSVIFWLPPSSASGFLPSPHHLCLVWSSSSKSHRILLTITATPQHPVPSHLLTHVSFSLFCFWMFSLFLVIFPFLAFISVLHI